MNLPQAKFLVRQNQSLPQRGIGIPAGVIFSFQSILRRAALEDEPCPRHSAARPLPARIPAFSFLYKQSGVNHHRRSRAPAQAPSVTGATSAKLYQVATKKGESSVQCAA